MGFEIPKYLQGYLSSEWRKPINNFVDTSQYYAGLNPFYLSYMDKVVRQCMAYATATVDGIYGDCLATNIGYNIVQTATKLVKGDKLLFNGDDEACAFLSDIWVHSSGFESFLDKAINYTLSGGTCAIKLNIDRRGRSVLTASRIDRNYVTTDDCGEVVEALFFISLLMTEKSLQGQIQEDYWLVEHRYYDGAQGVVEYNVHKKAGTADAQVLPTVFDSGIPYEQLTPNVKRCVDRMGIELNEKLPLPFFDGLGVWLLTRTASNSCIPDVKLGDPLLFGSLDLIWSLDVVYSGSLIDVLNGKGKVLLPQKFLSTLNRDLQQAAQKAGVKSTTLLTNRDFDDVDDSFAYVYTESDKDFLPQAVQFDIRSEEYREMWELYQKQIAVNTGFSPTSLFPHLVDNSIKTATEVTADENLTRATVQSLHRVLLPVFNCAIQEVLRQNGFKGTATLQLSDYIGNKIQRDNNIRQNFEIGLTPKDIAVQLVNGLDKKETGEYLEKLQEDRATELPSFGDDEFKMVDVNYS